jgi:hypothetical protein
MSAAASVVLPEGVVVLIRQPLAPRPTTSSAYHAALLLQPAGEVVEIPGVAGESVHAEDYVLVRRGTPVGVSDLVEPMRAEARETAFDHWNRLSPGVRV